VGDPKIEGVLSAVPYLKKLGVSADQLTYKFDYNGVRLIYLWTGKYDYRAPTSWDATRPTYDEQMKQLRQWLDEAKAAGTKKVFLTFHNPVFCRSGMGAIPEAQNPPQAACLIRKGPRRRRVQRARPHDRTLRGGGREIPAARRRRR
jgi:hypothetical protein